MSSDTLTKTPEQEAHEIGEALRILRDRLGVTQEAAAEAMEVSRTAWQNYEAGRKVVLRTDMQMRLAGAIGATRQDLLQVLKQLQHGGAKHSAIGVEEPGAIYSGPGRTQAIFPTRDGEVIVSYPANLSPEGYRELAEFFSLFAKRGGVQVSVA